MVSVIYVVIFAHRFVLIDVLFSNARFCVICYFVLMRVVDCVVLCLIFVFVLFYLVWLISFVAALEIGAELPSRNLLIAVDVFWTIFFVF